MSWIVAVRFAIAISLALAAEALCPAQPAIARPQFEVASVRENESDEKPSSNFPLNAGPQFGAKGGLLAARNFVLLQYIVFAYKPDMFQIAEFRLRLPDWARSSRFDIQARAAGNPSKDDMRSMMQELLAERFKMKVHHQMRTAPVFALMLAKLGKLGPGLQPHPPDDPSCARKPLAEQVTGAYPPECGAVAGIPARVSGNTAAGGQNVSLETLAAAVAGIGNIVDRRVIDRTGLTGTFDVTLEFAPESNGPGSSQPEAVGPGLAEALREQLGLKLVPQKAAVDIIVIDHLEKPSEN